MQSAASTFGEEGGRIFAGTAAGLVNGGVQAGIFDTKPNWGSIAAQSFGSALGDSFTQQKVATDAQQGSLKASVGGNVVLGGLDMEPTDYSLASGAGRVRLGTGSVEPQAEPFVDSDNYDLMGPPRQVGVVGKDGARGAWGIAQSLAGAGASNAEVNRIKNQLLALNPELADGVQKGQRYYVPDASTPENLTLARSADRQYQVALASRSQSSSVAWGEGLSFSGDGTSFAELAALGGGSSSPGATTSLSGWQRAQAHSLGVYDAGAGAIEGAGYSFGVVGTPESRAAWAVKTAAATVEGIRRFANDPGGTVSGWLHDLTGDDPAAIRQATAQGAGIAMGVGGGMVAGRLQGAPLGGLRQTGAGGLAGAADEAYALIRSSSTDVATIAENTGIKVSNIQKVKDHLFYNEHLLDRYESLGIPGEMKRFDSHLEIANTWQRLEAGTFKASDIQLLRHETAEAWYMRKYGSSYNNSHNAAHDRYPSPLE